MKLISSKKVETNRLEMIVEITAEEFETAIHKVYKKTAKSIAIPGFRKGKAPRKVIERYYGKECFYEDAVNDLYPDAMEWAIKEAGAEIVDNNIDFDIEKIGDEGLTFKAVITTKPEIEIGDYKKISAEKVKQEVKDDEVLSEIEAMRMRNSRLAEVTDRAAQKDDITIIDFDGSVDGVHFDGGKAEGFSLTLGSNQFIPGFEDQIIGHNAGEEFDINVKFPEDYGAAELAGKDAVFAIKLHEIKVRELPELDDEFAKDVSETADTVEDLKAEIKENILKAKEKAAEEEVENQIIDKIIETVKGEIPESMYEAKIDDSVREFDYRLQSQGMNLQDYLKYTGTEMDTFRKTFRDKAEKQVKIRLALEKIVELEKITVSAEEVDAEMQKYADAYKMDLEKIKEIIPVVEVEKDLAVSKAIDFVKENADVKEVAEKKPVAKKSTAKTTTKKTTTKKADSDSAEKKTTAKKPAAKKAPAKKTTKKEADAE